ncbi:STAS/SEC14 domain-containing protein [Kordia sp.]|uniref:STAS/SEC14 domain-containing protein n=1 Tax=Kordia sp. TaxID=1965332 RepID=UPI003D6BA0EB
MQIANGNSNSHIKKYTLQIGKVEIYENYMLAQLNEGITLNIESVGEIISIAHTHFPTQPFAYITIRKNSYAVDPMLYLKVFEIENLKAIAIVSDKFIDNHNVKIEKHFFNKPMNIFKTKEEAIIWSKTYL